MVDFKNLLNKTVTEEAKRPPSLPAGTYKGVISKWEPGESAQKKTPFVRFHVLISAAGDDIQPEQLDGIDLSKKQMRRDFYLTPDAEFRLHEFLKSCGVEFVGRSLSEALPECTGSSVLLNIVQKMNQDDPSQPPYNEITTMVGEANA